MSPLKPPSGTPTVMSAMRLHSRNHALSFEEVPFPRPREDEVLVKIAACGVRIRWTANCRISITRLRPVMKS